MKPEDIQHFLVTYFTRERRVDVREFGNDYDGAMAAYIDLERQYRDRDDLDIVLLGADSLDTVKRTHSSYFGDEGRSAFAHLFDDVPVHTIAGDVTLSDRLPLKRSRRRGSGEHR